MMSLSAISHRRNRRRIWMRALFQNRCIENRNVMSILDAGHFQNFTRMSPEDFEFLLQTVEPQIARQNTNFRQAISVKLRLAITLRFLATGDSYTSLQYIFKVSKQRIGVIVIETCAALIDGLRDYIKVHIATNIFINRVKQNLQKFKKKLV